MAIKFGQLEGKAKKSSINQFAYRDGDNVVRMVGDILPRYVYWIKGENAKNIPMECLSFNRNTETFDNKEKDWVRAYNPEMKCGWSYAIQCIDPTRWTGKSSESEEEVARANHASSRRFRRSYRSSRQVGTFISKGLRLDLWHLMSNISYRF